MVKSLQLDANTWSITIVSAYTPSEKILYMHILFFETVFLKSGDFFALLLVLPTHTQRNYFYFLLFWTEKKSPQESSISFFHNEQQEANEKNICPPPTVETSKFNLIRINLSQV